MLYFINCDRCGAEVKVTPLKTQQYRAVICHNCGADLVFASAELKEGRLLIVIRCPNLDCAAYEKEQWVLLARTFLQQTFAPSGDDNVVCPTCGQTFRLSSCEKENIRKLLEMEAIHEAAC